MSAYKVSDINAQNFHIARQHEYSQKAIKKLIEMGVTITAVHLGDWVVQIEVMPTPKLNQMSVVTEIIIGTGAGRRVRKVVKLHNCYVTWESKSIH